MTKKNGFLQAISLAVAASVCALPALADDTEDMSAAFEADLVRIGAERGIADAASTVSTDEAGVTSAVVGLSHLKMLVVRKNDDGTLSFDHVSSAEDVDGFVSSDVSDDQAATEK